MTDRLISFEVAGGSEEEILDQIHEVIATYGWTAYDFTYRATQVVHRSARADGQPSTTIWQASVEAWEDDL